MSSYEQVRNAVLQKGYHFFDNMEPYNINLIGIRKNYELTNRFDDRLIIAYRNQELGECVKLFEFTTKPGLFYFKNPIAEKGTGILPEGQYPGMWAIGKHKGRYEALVQVKPVKVFRDNDKDEMIDLLPGAMDFGEFGINCHHAGEESSTIVDKWSALCQVHKAKDNHLEMMKFCKLSAALYGNSFTYTLINQKDYDKAI